MSNKETTKAKKVYKPTGKAVKVSLASYDYVVAEALRQGIRQGRIVTIQEVLDQLILSSLDKPKPELKE